MNYYEHHLGDYDGATAHLSWLEDCAYRRMLCLYYRTEAPLPADVKQVCRLVRATSKPERDAVQQVLTEFFELAGDGWHNGRCDEDISAYHDLEPEREAKRENAKERQRRARARRAELFEALRGHNIVPPFDTATKALEALLSRVTGALPVTAPVTPVTRDDTATHTHLPPPTSQISPSESASRAAHEARTGSPPPDSSPPSAAAVVCLAMRRAAMPAVNPSDPRLLALLAQGATVDEFVDAARAAVAKGKPWGWALGCVEGRRRDAAGIALAPPPPDPMAWRKTLAGVQQRGAELGVTPRPDEQLDAFERRVLDAHRRAVAAPTTAPR